MTEYVTIETGKMPRLPYEASLDLTYRCNNNCRHCWLWLPANAPEQQRELSFDDITRIVDQARGMGCRRWSISGGEPMLRPDFADIFDYITRNSGGYSLNTNGSSITPRIAQLLTRKGFKMVALYGATAEVHDHITRNPGSFDATMQGFAYLKEAGAGFVVQIVPMRDNYHQFQQMVDLALTWSPQYRIGAPWLYLSASGSRGKNREIAEQRLKPSDVVELDRPDVCYRERRASRDADQGEEATPCPRNQDDRVFASCIASRRDFHIDPYGQATFCSFIKDPAMLYDLRAGTVEECWTKFIPSLADVVRGGREYKENCGSCEYRPDCRWCAVYGYLEHRRFSAPVQYLCAAARESRKFKIEWKTTHRRFFQIAGITIQLDSDLPIVGNTLHPRFDSFRATGPGDDTVSIRHHFSLPDLKDRDLGRLVYQRTPWAIYEKGDSWLYLGKVPGPGNDGVFQVAEFSQDHSRAVVYNNDTNAAMFRKGRLTSLTLFPTDQIWLARLLADRQGCYLHASGVVLNNQGFLFLGHSGAGKSTMVTMLRGKSEILCDDRMIVRRWPDGFRVHGTWSHGDVPHVSSSSAPLRAILFLEQAPENAIIPVDDKKNIMKRLVPCLIKPFQTADWWEKELNLLEQIAHHVGCYVLRFDQRCDIVPMLERMQ